MAYDMNGLMEMFAGRGRGRTSLNRTLGSQESAVPSGTLGSGGRTTPGGDAPVPTLAGGDNPFDPVVNRVRRGGFWQWLVAQGMPEAMLAAIRQDPNLQARYFEQYKAEQYKAEQDAKKPQNAPGPGQSTSGGTYGGGGKKRNPLDPLQPGDIGYIRDGGSINRGFFPSGGGSPLSEPWGRNYNTTPDPFAEQNKKRW